MCVFVLFIWTVQTKEFLPSVGRWVCRSMNSNRNKNNNHRWIGEKLVLFCVVVVVLQWNSSRIEMNGARHIEHVFEIFPHSLTLLLSKWKTENFIRELWLSLSHLLSVRMRARNSLAMTFYALPSNIKAKTKNKIKSKWKKYTLSDLIFN